MNIELRADTFSKVFSSFPSKVGKCHAKMNNKLILIIKFQFYFMFGNTFNFNFDVCDLNYGGIVLGSVLGAISKIRIYN